MPKHITRLIVLMVAFVVIAYAAKRYFTVDSFYQWGHYRGDSVAEIASDKPKFQGSDSCKSCHAARYAEWSAGVHHSVSVGKVVQCEVCHGAAGERDVKGMFDHVSTGVVHPAGPKLAMPTDSIKLCSVCHEKMPGRPAGQKQIDIATHAGTQQCTTCHNPHAPKTMLGFLAPDAKPADATAGKAAVCMGCHGGDGVSTNPVWPNLAGQHDAYLLNALRAYKSGARDNAMMVAVVKGLSDADMHDLSVRFAGMKGKAVVAGASGADPAVAAGKAKAEACAGCHGANGVSTSPEWPNLAGQSKDYIVNALKAYRSGTRNNDVMAGMAKGLTDSDMDALAAYFSHAHAD